MTELRHSQLVTFARLWLGAASFAKPSLALKRLSFSFTVNLSQPVQIATVQPLVRRLNKIKPPDLLICDECRHVLADSYLKTLRRFKGARLLGLTAMPLRMGGQLLGARAQRAQDRSGRLRRRIEDFRAGRVKNLCNAELFGEVLEVGAAMLVHPTESLTLYTQQARRALRPKSSGGKAVIIDLAGNSLTFGRPDLNRK